MLNETIKFFLDFYERVKGQWLHRNQNEQLVVITRHRHTAFKWLGAWFLAFFSLACIHCHDCLGMNYCQARVEYETQMIPRLKVASLFCNANLGKCISEIGSMNDWQSCVPMLGWRKVAWETLLIWFVVDAWCGVVTVINVITRQIFVILGWSVITTSSLWLSSLSSWLSSSASIVSSCHRL